MHKYQETEEKQPENKVITDFKQNDYSQSIVDNVKPKDTFEKKIENKVEKKSTLNVMASKVEDSKEKKGPGVHININSASPVEPTKNFVERLEEKVNININQDKNPPKEKNFVERLEDKVNININTSGNESINENKNFVERLEEKVNTKKDASSSDNKSSANSRLNDSSQSKKKAKDTFDKKEKLKEIFNAVIKPTTEEIKFRKNTNPDKDGKIVAGWLVVHTENKSPITYELFEGVNVIGRPDGSHHVDIKIEEDRYVSREHCYINVLKDFLHRFVYILYDGSEKPAKESTNGTFINGLEDKMDVGSKIYLKDGDIVQVGETKLAFKNTDESADYHEAANSVIQTDYTKTVAIQFNPNQ